ncbi:MAG: ABC transporter permease [Spongiibacteraceae bacterium]|nr:ABC transporter permease [Spongiibacteraceae bacterium]
MTLLTGCWRGEATLPSVTELRTQFEAARSEQWRFSAGDSFEWDSRLLTRLLPIARYCETEQIELDLSALPPAVARLLGLALAVAPAASAAPPRRTLVDRYRAFWRNLFSGTHASVAFVGECTLAFGRFLRGGANTRGIDILWFIQQCGPQALPIVALISVLVGMILAYLGSVQLRQFGAEVYVADLVTIGMVREMAALMTAVIMAGRTGAAYAAQLGAMQANEEIDAITTLGISPIEYLVLPRMLALILVMPLLYLFSVALGLGGGALVAAGLDVNLLQFINSAREAVDLTDIGTGLFKSLAFAVVIAAAGCHAGLLSGRSSSAVGQATTRAVVHAIVYLVVVDAGLNILYNELGI